MAVDGRVVTGFSHPCVAVYAAGEGATVTYSKGMTLARGVSVKLNIKEATSNDFYADNHLAESETGMFADGSVDLEVDGLHPAAEKLIAGLPEATPVTYGSEQTTNVTKYGDGAVIPYVGIGYVTEYTSEGVKIYVPTILRKAKFGQISNAAHTREASTDWQTQTLTAQLMRDDTAGHDWKWVGQDCTTEAEAMQIVDGLLNISRGD